MTARPFGALERVAVTEPPQAWGMDPAAAALAWDVLSGLGLQLIRVPTQLLLEGDSQRLQALCRELQAFRPQCVIATPNAGYAARAALRDGRNFFLDVLAVPVLLTWDSVVQFADQLLTLPHDPEASTAGTLDRLRRFVAHPLVMHAAFDRGQIQVMDQLGLVPAADVTYVPAFAHREYVTRGATSVDGPVDDEVAFFGTLGTPQLDPRLAQHPWVWDLTREAVVDRPLTQPVWDRLLERILAMPEPVQRERRLSPDDSFFWSVALQCLAGFAPSHDRLRVLAAVGRPVSVYGAAATGERLPENLTYRGRIEMASELPSRMARSAVTVDVVNRIMHTGVTSKIYSCFAAGGLCLFDRRADFTELVGADLAEAVTFSDEAEVAAKVEGFLSHPERRREVTRAVRDRILPRCETQNTYGLLIEALCHRWGYL